MNRAKVDWSCLNSLKAPRFKNQIQRINLTSKDSNRIFWNRYSLKNKKISIDTVTQKENKANGHFHTSIVLKKSPNRENCPKPKAILGTTRI